MATTFRSCALFVFASIALYTGFAAAESMQRYNVVWETPSRDSTGQMPLGNGDIAAGVYAIENGDLYLLLAKNDALTYNGDIFKTGRVRVSLEPSPFAAGKPFRQTLDLDTGSILIEADGVTLRIWADANHPVYHVQIDSPNEVAVSAAPELWQRFDGCKWNVSSAPIDSPTQDVRLERDGKILWYFAVGDRSIFPEEMKYYDVPQMISEFADPLRFNTFGTSGLGTKERTTARTSNRPVASETAGAPANRPRPCRAKTRATGTTTATTSLAASKPWP